MANIPFQKFHSWNRGEDDKRAKKAQLGIEEKREYQESPSDKLDEEGKRIEGGNWTARPRDDRI